MLDSLCLPHGQKLWDSYCAKIVLSRLEATATLPHRNERLQGVCFAHIMETAFLFCVVIVSACSAVGLSLKSCIYIEPPVGSHRPGTSSTDGGAIVSWNLLLWLQFRLQASGSRDLSMLLARDNKPLNLQPKRSIESPKPPNLTP